MSRATLAGTRYCGAAYHLSRTKAVPHFFLLLVCTPKDAEYPLYRPFLPTRSLLVS